MNNNDKCSHLIYLFLKNPAFPAPHCQKPYTFPTFPTFSLKTLFFLAFPAFPSFAAPLDTLTLYGSQIAENLATETDNNF